MVLSLLVSSPDAVSFWSLGEHSHLSYLPLFSGSRTAQHCGLKQYGQQGSGEKVGVTSSKQHPSTRHGYDIT